MTKNDLYKTYPKLFRQVKLSAYESCMHWGIQCGNGWLTLIQKLSTELNELVSRHPDMPIEYAQIKEKFAGLVVSVDYPNGATSEYIKTVNDIIQPYRLAASLTCEICGEAGTRYTSDGGWISILCDTHKNERASSSGTN